MRAVAVVIPLVLVAACSGGGGEGKSQYVAKAEAVCTTANHDFAALAAPAGTADLVPYVEKLVGIADTATGKLGDLQPPDKDRAVLDKKVMGPLRSQVTVGRQFVTQVRTAVQQHDQASLARLVSNPPTGTKADLGWMRSYGFKQCVTMADTGSR